MFYSFFFFFGTKSLKPLLKFHFRLATSQMLSRHRAGGSVLDSTTLEIFASSLRYEYINFFLILYLIVF